MNQDLLKIIELVGALPRYHANLYLYVIHGDRWVSGHNFWTTQEFLKGITAEMIVDEKTWRSVKGIAIETYSAHLLTHPKDISKFLLQLDKKRELRNNDDYLVFEYSPSLHIKNMSRITNLEQFRKADTINLLFRLEEGLKIWTNSIKYYEFPSIDSRKERPMFEQLIESRAPLLAHPDENVRIMAQEFDKWIKGKTDVDSDFFDDLY